MPVRRHVYTVPTRSTVYDESSCREFMSRVHVDSSCREFMLRVYVERLCSDFARHVMFRLHSSYDVLRHWACSDGMFFADALSESCIFNETTTKVLSILHHSARLSAYHSQHASSVNTRLWTQHNTLSMLSVAVRASTDRGGRATSEGVLKIKKRR